MFSGDASGLSDPYAVISFSNHSKATVVIRDTRCPVWNQTILMKDIELCGNKAFIMEHVPPVTVEIWDKDKLVNLLEAKYVNDIVKNKHWLLWPTTS